MAKQTINQGTAPTGAGGDTFRSGSAKLQANDNELYDFIGGAANTTTLPAALPLTKGGTGATTAAARTNLGLGTAATATLTTSTTDIIAGRVLKVGDFGWGSNKSSALSLPQVFKEGTKEQLAVTQVVNNISDNVVGNGSGFSWSTTQLGTRVHGLIGGGSNSNLYHVHVEDTSVESASRIIKKSIVRTEANTTIDANGFIKNASPIVKLFTDKIELNDEARLQDITFEKLGVGDYLIKGSSGFAEEGWYIETPKDANGNVLFSVIYTTLENGDISVKTYKKKLDLETASIVADLENPVDITENRWIDLRLQELPQPEIEEPESITSPDFQPTGLAEAVATVMESYNDTEQ